MTTSNPPTTPAASSAVQTWTPQAVADLMGQYEPSRYNRLFPVEALSQVNPMLAPRIEVVRLSADEAAKEIYHSNDMKAGEFAPTKVGLRKLMDLAGATMVDSRRLDDGADPWYVLWRVTMELAVPGRPSRRAMGSKEIRLSGDAVKGWTGERLAKAREHMIAMAESKAANRALRDLLTLRSAYPKAELTKPFAVMRWEPNMAHPLVAERFLDNLLPAAVAAYGPGADQVAHLGAGEPAYEMVPARTGEDEPITASFVEVRTNGHATVDASTGEIVAESGPEPDWFDDAAAAPGELSFADRLRAEAETREDADGKPLPAEVEKLKALLAPVRAEVGRVLRSIYGVATNEIEQGQVQAILLVASQLGEAAFREEWLAVARSLDGGAK